MNDWALDQLVRLGDMLQNMEATPQTDVLMKGLQVIVSFTHSLTNPI